MQKEKAPEGAEIIRRLEKLEADYLGMSKTLDAIDSQIQSLLKLAKENLNTEIKDLQDAFCYEDRLKKAFNELLAPTDIV